MKLNSNDRSVQVVGVEEGIALEVGDFKLEAAEGVVLSGDQARELANELWRLGAEFDNERPDSDFPDVPEEVKG